VSHHLLNSLSMAKYERFLPRIFPGSKKIEVRKRQGDLFWSWSPATSEEHEPGEEEDDNPVVAWAEFGTGIEQRQLPDDRRQFRAAISLKGYGSVAWLIATYDTRHSISMGVAPEPMRRAFADARIFLQEEIELQSECNQLAAELTERYEELNLVYSTKDQVEYFEEGQEALSRLVHNCTDYLDVGLSALICRDRGIMIHNISGTESPPEIDELLELLETTVYDRVESQVQSVVLNEASDDERVRIFRERTENLLAYPIDDDHGTAIGLLAVVARHDMHVFSNGDRNLLEVMAKKASRIIHTHHDSLTGLVNRGGFESSLISSLGSTQSNNLQHVLLHINIDQLHVINDLMGYQEGDVLIRRVAKCLRIVLRDTDIVSRFGGGDFGVLLLNCDVRQGYSVADKIRNKIAELTVVSATRTLDVSACIGLTQVNRDTDGIVSVMAAAEIACKSAKDSGRDRIEVFAEDNTTLVRRSEEIEWIGRVQEALRQDLFVLYCQPVMPIDAGSGAPHFEILIRMRDKDGEILAPAAFLPAAERYQLMPAVDRWVIHHSLKAIAACWDSISAEDPVFCINLSGQSFTSPGFQPYIADELRDSGIPAENICFEVTETAAISNIDEAVAFMAALKTFGCRFSLDDFGAGLSSFGYLKVLPVDYLKIDGSFVREIVSDEISHSMVEAICQIGKTMNLAMVAEFVGDEATVEALRTIGVDYVQGFHIGMPEPLEHIIESLEGQARKGLA